MTSPPGYGDGDPSSEVRDIGSRRELCRSDAAKVEVRLDLAADSGAARTARDALRTALAGQPASLQDNVSLLVSELVSNSVQHGPTEAGSEIGLSVVVDRGAVRIEVSDHSAGTAVRKPPSSARGYGLDLVEAIATRWGTERRGDANVTWFEMELPPSAE